MRRIWASAPRVAPTSMRASMPVLLARPHARRRALTRERLLLRARRREAPSPDHPAGVMAERPVGTAVSALEGAYRPACGDIAPAFPPALKAAGIEREPR